MRLKMDGKDEVSFDKDSVALRNHRLRDKKRNFFSSFWPHDYEDNSLSSILFPNDPYPTEYKDGDEIPVWVGSISSKRTLLSYNPFSHNIMCHNEEENSKKMEFVFPNFGETLRGKTMHVASMNNFKVAQNVACKPICLTSMGGNQIQFLRRLIEKSYRIHFEIDSLPLLMKSRELNFAVRGFPIGFMSPPSFTAGPAHDQFYLYNHFKFTVNYQRPRGSSDLVRIVGFDVYPVSIQHQIKQGDLNMTVSTCNEDTTNQDTLKNNPKDYLPLRLDASGDPMKVLYSYEVQWTLAEMDWSDRWDIYLIGMPDTFFHIVGLIKGLFLCTIVLSTLGASMIKTLRRDIAEFSNREGPIDHGWRAIRGDVFRPPANHPMILSVLFGTGIQLTIASLMTLIAATMQWVNVMINGQILTMFIISCAFSSVLAGFGTAKLNKFLGATNYQTCALWTAVLVPSIIFFLFIIINSILSFAQAATALSMWIVLNLLFLWLFVTIPLIVLGSLLGYHHHHQLNNIEVVAETNAVPRIIPREQQSWYTQFPWSAILVGAMQFSVISSESFLLMHAIWLDQYYYQVHFVLMTFLMLSATTCLGSIMACYAHLRAEDYQWWWKSFVHGAMGGASVFLYGLWYASTSLDLLSPQQGVSVLLYVLYMFIMSGILALICGSIGFASCFVFVRTIYSFEKTE